MSVPNDSSSTSPQKEMKQCDLTLDQLTDQVIREIEPKRGFLQRLWQRILQWFSPGPRTEIHHAWLHVNTFAERAVKRFNSKQSDDGDWAKKRNLATVKAYLTLARRERDFAQTWTYVNLADALLPLVVDEDELEACMQRLRTSEEYLPALKKYMDESKFDWVPVDAKQGPKDIEKSDPSQSSKCEKDRFALHREQIVRADFWNVANRKVSLKRSLWHSVGIKLFVSLVLAVVVAELIYSQSNNLVPIPFVSISLLGFFGGGLSAFLTARQSVINIPSYELIKLHSFLRMLLGAAGSFVVYVVAQWPGLFEESIRKLLHENIYVFLSIGIAAGFSERLFVGALEKVADKLLIAGEPDEEKK